MEFVSEVFNHPPNETGSSADYKLTVLIIQLSHLLYSFNPEELYTETTTVRSKKNSCPFLRQLAAIIQVIRVRCVPSTMNPDV